MNQHTCEWNQPNPRRYWVRQLWHQLQRVAVLLQHMWQVRNTSKSNQKDRFTFDVHLDSFLQWSAFTKVCVEMFSSSHFSTHDSRILTTYLGLDDLTSIGDGMACTVLNFSGAAFLDPKRWWNFDQWVGHSVYSVSPVPSHQNMPKLSKTHFWTEELYFFHFYPRLSQVSCGASQRIGDSFCLGLRLGSQTRRKERQHWFWGRNCGVPVIWSHWCRQPKRICLMQTMSCSNTHKPSPVLSLWDLNNLL